MQHMSGDAECQRMRGRKICTCLHTYYTISKSRKAKVKLGKTLVENEIAIIAGYSHSENERKGQASTMDVI